MSSRKTKTGTNHMSWQRTGGLTHWGRLTHICVNKLTVIDSDNSFSPGRCQAIILTNAWMLWTGPIGIYFSEILIEMYTFLLKKMHFKMSSGKWRPFCLGFRDILAIIWVNAGILLIGPLGTNFSEIVIQIKHFHWGKCVWKCRLRKGSHFVSASMC